MAGHQRGAVAGEVERQLGDVLRLADAADRGFVDEGFFEAGHIAQALGERGADQSGADGVNADAVAPQFERGDFGEHRHAGLGRAVGGEPFGGLHRVEAGGVDQAAALALRDQLLRLVLEADEHTGEADIDHAAESVDLVVLDRREAPDAGVVEGDVEPSEVLNAGVDHRGCIVLARHVAADGGGVVADLARGFGDAVGVAVGEHDARAGFSEELRGAQADARCAAGDQRYLAVESAH